MDVSIVIASWNAAAFLPAAVSCALSQADVSLEVLVCDDASTDATPELMASFDDPRVRYIRLAQNGGPAAARNAGLSVAAGEWVMIFDADDSMSADRARKLIDIGRSRGSDVVADNFTITGARAQGVGTLHIDEPLDGGVEEITLSRYIADNVMFGSAPALGYLKPVFRREALTRLGLRYATSLRIGEDFALVAELLAAGGRFHRVRSADYTYHTHDGSISHRLRKADLQSMIDFDRRFAARCARDAAASDALRAHRDALEQALAFTGMVEALKGRSPGAFVRALRQNPRGIGLFRIPLRDRWRRFRARA